ncbi:MAG: amino acid racemase [Oscillospiraceae bacterium]|nr:amino acid racemase [Oscillospiraceae bacterium]
MKTIGVIGGLSWQSTVDYYRIINETENRILGGAATGDVIVYSVNLEEMLGHVDRGELDVLGEKLGAAARKLEAAGAELIVLATNTMHIAAERIAAAVNVPFLHITDALAQEICRRGMKKVGLLGTPFTMGLPFYREKLLHEYGIEVITPPETEHALIFDVIRNELTFNIIRDASRREYLRIMEDLAARGAEGIILGCTEIPMLIKQEHTEIPVFDTTYLHAAAAAEQAANA